MLSNRNDAAIRGRFQTEPLWGFRTSFSSVTARERRPPSVVPSHLSLVIFRLLTEPFKSAPIMEGLPGPAPPELLRLVAIVPVMIDVCVPPLITVRRRWVPTGPFVHSVHPLGPRTKWTKTWPTSKGSCLRVSKTFPWILRRQFAKCLFNSCKVRVCPGS